MVGPDESIFSICDLKTVAIKCDLHESDLSLVKIGCPIKATFSVYADRIFSGSIVYLGSRLDPKTRTIPARALIDNRDRLLKLNMFASVTIEGAKRLCLTCPKDSLHESEGKTVVYVRSGPRNFAAKPVITGITCGDTVEIVSGLKAGEEIVTDGGVLVKAELLMEHNTQ